MQIMYQGKTAAIQPRDFKFPNGFAISQKLKHYSNEAETLTLIGEVIKPPLPPLRTSLHTLTVPYNYCKILAIPPRSNVRGVFLFIW